MGSGHWRARWWGGRHGPPKSPQCWGDFLWVLLRYWGGMMSVRSRRGVRGVTRPLVESAQRLRRELTPAEQALWNALRGRRVAGLRFRCQHAVGPFVLDFYCPAAQLVIEVDGAIHDQQVEQDAARTEHLEAYGYRVLRFRNDEVLTDLGAVLASIEQATIPVSTQHRLRQGSRTTLPSPETPPKPPPKSPPSIGGI